MSGGVAQNPAMSQVAAPFPRANKAASSALVPLGWQAPRGSGRVMSVVDDEAARGRRAVGCDFGRPAAAAGAHSSRARSQAGGRLARP